MATPEVLRALESVVEERDWAQFHTPENLAKSIVIEAAELLECFQWNSDFEQGQVEEELADVLTYCYLMAARLQVRPTDIVARKLEKTRSKYPVDRSRGSSVKYDQL